MVFDNFSSGDVRLLTETSVSGFRRSELIDLVRVKSTQPITLSEIEYEVIRGIARGLKSEQIAERINRKKPTVESYVRVLYAKFQARSRAHLVAQAIVTGNLPLSELNDKGAKK